MERALDAVRAGLQTLFLYRLKLDKVMHIDLTFLNSWDLILIDQLIRLVWKFAERHFGQ